MTVFQQSKVFWAILVVAAKKSQIFTYTEIGEMTGVSTRKVGKYLFPIQYYCEAKKHPKLTVLVVNKVTGQPGNGLPVTKFPKELQDVFNFDWLKYPVPNEEDFKEAIRAKLKTKQAKTLK